MIFLYLLLGLAAVLAAAFVVLVIVVALQPADFRIVRSQSIAAPPSKIFGHVDELRRWEAWSPWAKLDPAMKTIYDGPPAGPGAKYAWDSDKVGAGKMTILDSRPAELVQIQLDFKKPFEATNIAEFTFVPESGGTLVTWSMHGKKDFMSKGAHLFMDIDKMVGGDFEKGLASLKAIAEK